MKTIRALNKWRKGYPLSSREQYRVDNLFLNLKIAAITIGLTIAVIMLISQSGCLEGSITREELQQMP